MLTGHALFLLVPDVAAALDYYREVLAFEVEAHELVPEDNGTATRDGCTIFFNRGPRASPNSELVPPDLFDVYLWTDDVRALYEEFGGGVGRTCSTSRVQGHGMLEIRVRDLNGYVLGIGETIEP